MKVSDNIIFILSVAVSIILMGCDAHKKEHHDEAKGEKHADEIVLTPQQAGEADLKVETARAGDFMSVLKVSGQIQSPLGEEQTVAATANGIVSFSNPSITEGASIRAGQSVVTISAKKLQDGDPMQKARIAYETAEREYRRTEVLAADKIISAKDFEQVRLRYETAKAAYQGQAADMTAKGVSVSSPISGYIKNRSVKQGDYVSVGDPLVTVTQNRRLQLRAEVPENSAKYLKNISSANFKVAYDDATYKLSELNGTLLSYGKTAGANSYYLPVTFEFDNVGDFVAGSFAEVYLLSHPRKNVLSVPISALTEEQGVYYVYGDRIEITKGLAPGDIVVVKGTYQVKLAASSTSIPEGHQH